MVYSPIDDFVALELLTAEDLNHMIDNIEALKDPPSAEYTANEASDYTTTSASFVDVDSTNLSLTITTAGGDVMVGFHGGVEANGGTNPLVHFEVLVDGVQHAGNDGIIFTRLVNLRIISFVRLITGLSAGSHTFKLQWKVNGGVKLYAGAGTASHDVHPQFWAREVS